MKQQEFKKHQTKSLKNLIATIIALLGVVGLLNRSIGSFLTFTFYYLFGTAAPLFFALVVIGAFVFINRINRQSKRFYILCIAFFVLVLTFAALFYQYTFPSGGYEVLEPSLVRLGSYTDFYLNPAYLYTKIHGGVVGGFIYASLFNLGGQVLALIIIFVLLFLAVIFTFWPLIVIVNRNVSSYILTIRHRNQVIRKARQLPSSQSQAPLKQNNVPIDEDSHHPQQINYFGNQTNANAVKRAVFGGEVTQESFSFNPVVVDISKARQSQQPAIDADEILDQIQKQDINLTPLVEEEQASENTNIPSTEVDQVTKTYNDVQQPSLKDDNRLSLENIIQHETLLEAEDIEIPLVNPLFEKSDIENEPIIERIVAVAPKEQIAVEVKLDEPKTPRVETKKVEKKTKKYIYPSMDLLTSYTPEDEMHINNRAAELKMDIINSTFNSFNLGAQAVSYTIGPSITRFDIKMDDDKSVNTLTRYINDLNIRLKGEPGRFEEIVSGRVTSGFEVPNEKKVPVTLKDCISELPKGEKYNFAVPFGKNIDGRVIWGLLDDFPHLLVAGSTGSGKSVYVHTILITLLMRSTPEELKLLIIDPKRVEMNKYKDIPHLLCPIVKEAKEARIALEKLVEEMEERYRLFENVSANKLAEYNSLARKNGEKVLPRIVVVIDEYADLVEYEKDTSTHVLRIAQKSRAAGIHLIVATQRPSTTVITGQIKANLPTRVALMTASAIDSTVILGSGGAEQLLGNGDMLVDCTQISRQGFTRIQGAYVDNEEIRAVTDFLKETYETEYASEFLDLSDRGNNGFVAGTVSTYKDELYEEVKQYVLTLDTISINRIQTNFSMAYNRAKMIYEMLMGEGVISPPDAANSSRGAKVIHEYELSPEEIRIDQNDY